MRDSNSASEKELFVKELGIVIEKNRFNDKEKERVLLLESVKKKLEEESRIKRRKIFKFSNRKDRR